MVMYVIQIPPPPAGVDWSTAVPGNRYWDVTGITATLTDFSFPSMMIDYSGNGRHGVYFADSGAGYPALVAGLISGDLARRWTDAAAVNSGYGVVNGTDVDLNGPYSFEAWVESVAGVQTEVVPLSFGNATAQTSFLFIGATGGVEFFRESLAGTEDHQAAAGAVPVDGVPHHVVVTFDGATSVLYVDGVVIPWTVDDPAVSMTPAAFDVRLGNWQFASGLGGWIQDETAVYPYALTAGQVGTHHTAGLAGFAAYVPVILADNPSMYYHLNATPTGGRQPSLVVTDGTTDVLTIPTGFPATPLPGPYRYAWQPGLNADTQSSDGTLTTVAIPPLLLPAGYTVGVRTLDLSPTDEWGPITIWWNDALQESLEEFNPYQYAPGVNLRYQQIGT